MSAYVPIFSKRLAQKFIPNILLILALVLLVPGRTAKAATIVVGSTADSTVAGDGACTLREAIANADGDTDTTGGDCVTGSGADTINFSPAIIGQTITLAGSELTISSGLTIDASVTGMVIDGNRATTFGGGITNGSTGMLTVNRTTVQNNTVDSPVRPQAGGGGINNSGGTVTLNNSTISGNMVNGAATSNHGGGLRNTSPSTLIVNNSTIVNNSASFSGGGVNDSGTFTIRNSIFANNMATQGPDCYGTVSADYSLIERTTNCTVAGANNVLGVDPKLGPIEANGGGTITLPLYTHVPLDDSPALDAGDPTNCQDVDLNPVTEDQRGSVRPVDSGGGNICDLGAVERQANESTDQYCSWMQGVPHAFGTDVNVTITPNTANNPGCITVLKRGVFAGKNQDDGEFPIVWSLTAANSTFNLNVKFCYSDTELATAGVVDETSIVIYHLENGVWGPQTTATDPSNNCVSVSGVTSLSPWTLVGNGNVPTAIELQNLTARAVSSSQTLALALVALLGLALGVFLLRSRR